MASRKLSLVGFPVPALRVARERGKPQTQLRWVSRVHMHSSRAWGIASGILHPGYCVRDERLEADSGG